MLIINANIITMEDENYENGYILVSDGKIAEVGDMQNAPADNDVYDAEGMTLYPGFIDAHCHLGMWEDALGFEGDDGNEETDPVTPQLRAVDAINPLDRTFTEAVAGGITTVLTGPGSANAIGGSITAINLAFMRNKDRPQASYSSFMAEDLGNIETSGNNLRNKFRIKN